MPENPFSESHRTSEEVVLSSMPTNTVAKEGFYRKIVMGLLSKMNAGKLNITFPSGEVRSLGNGDG
jgi:hypothetical protein